MFRPLRSLYASGSVVSAKYLLAGRDDTPINVLVWLAFDGSDKVRRRVAENPRTPTPILDMLASDRNSEVRLAVSENRWCSNSLLEILMQDPCDDVRFGIAENYYTPIECLEKLTTDQNPHVAWRARKTLTTHYRQGFSQAA